MEEAAESEDYERADQCQTEIDQIQEDTLPRLREELQLCDT